MRRIPNLSFTTTTSPCAISVPLTITSSDSSAIRSNSTTEPWFNCSRLRMLILERPTSIEMVTGISIMVSSLRRSSSVIGGAVFFSSSSGAAKISSTSISGALGSSPSAAAHSSASLSSSLFAIFNYLLVLFIIRRYRAIIPTS
ncbi:Uncharacterised protein [Vibrio cholerae]|uniref:Uncharacterized protein n=1 Tax=Vibrio cholerae TaxID=666 RepID=A0A655NSB0_VIBCL|nr:Uncharacterised protein [Vibrio cholerae]